MKSTDKSIQEEKPVEESNDDSVELLSKSETATLLKALAKSI